MPYPGLGTFSTAGLSNGPPISMRTDCGTFADMTAVHQAFPADVAATPLDLGDHVSLPIRRLWHLATMQIMTRSNALIRADDITVSMSPDTAERIGNSAEVRTYNATGLSGKMAHWNMPEYLYGLRTNIFAGRPLGEVVFTGPVNGPGARTILFVFSVQDVFAEAPAKPTYGDGHLCTWSYCEEYDHEGSYLVQCGQCQAVGFAVVANETMTHVVVASQEADEPALVDGVATPA